MTHVIRNAEDVRREDTELQPASQNVLTLDGEVLAMNGKLLAGHTGGSGAGDGPDADQVSVCSCTCLGPSTCGASGGASAGCYQPCRPDRPLQPHPPASSAKRASV